MKRLLSAALIATAAIANTAWGEDFCGLSPDQARSVPKRLGGEWEALMRGGFVSSEGKVSAIHNASGGTLPVTFVGDDGNLTLHKNMLFEGVTFVPLTEVQDFSLPGQPPLLPPELMQAEAAISGLTCDVKSLPQFHAVAPGKMVSVTGAVVSYDIYALSPKLMVMVEQIKSPSVASRLVFDLHRRH